MTPAERLAKLVRKKNKELEKNAKEEFIVGSTFIGLTYGGLAFLSGCVLAFVYGMGTGFVYGFGIGLTMLSLAAMICWRTVNPTRSYLPLDDPDAICEMLDNGTPQTMLFHPEHELPRFLSIVTTGPESVLKGYGLKQNLISTDEELLERSMKLLKRCNDGYPLKRMKNPEAAVLLRQMGLVRTDRREAGLTLALTQDGDTLLEHGKH